MRVTRDMFFISFSWVHFVLRKFSAGGLCCSSGFPGSQPVSMDNSNLQMLKHKPYKVSWKADGTR